MTDLTPPSWAGIIAQQLDRTPFGFIRRDANGNLPTRTVETPRDPEWLAARAAFLTEWEAAKSHGLAEGFLEQDSCYECAGAIEPTTDTVIRTHEPNPDYIAAPLPDFIRITRA